MFHPSSKCFFPSRVMGRMLEPIPAARGRVHCWTAHQPHCTALSEHLGVCFLTQGYLGSALKVSWHLSCYQHTFSTFCLPPGTEPRTPASRPSPLQTELPPPDAQSEVKAKASTWAVEVLLQAPTAP